MHHWSTELRKRVISGVFGGVLLVAGIFYGGLILIFLLVVALSLGLTYEYGKICFRLSDQTEKLYVLLILAWLASVVNLLIPQAEGSLMTGCFLLQ